MTAKSFAWAGLFILGAAALAGCVNAQAGTAMGGEPAAQDEAAQKWSSDAVLVGVMGVEGTFPGSSFGFSTDRTGDHLSRASRDPTVGDGKAEVWFYGFMSPSMTNGFVVVVDKDGKVVDSFEEDDVANEVAIGEWKINSDEALRIAKEANEGLRTGVESANFGLMSMLHRDAGGGNAEWLIAGGGGDSSGGGGGMVRIDAVTGAVLESEGGFSNRP